MALTGNELYGLFNNGAYGQPGAAEDLPINALCQQFNINFLVQARYYITFPTYLVGFMTHILPKRWLDKLLCKLGN